MGWGNCGEDSTGRPIGYLHDATCDHPGCEAKIRRGLAYVCGRDMHGDTELGCERYFCPEHVTLTRVGEDDSWAEVCEECRKAALAEISQLGRDEREVEA